MEEAGIAEEAGVGVLRGVDVCVYSMFLCISDVCWGVGMCRVGGLTDEPREEELILLLARNHQCHFHPVLAFMAILVIHDSPTLVTEESLQVPVIGNGPVESLDCAVGSGHPERAAGDGELVALVRLEAGELDEGSHEESVFGGHDCCANAVDAGKSVVCR